jgi:hypothetical protein
MLPKHIWRGRSIFIWAAHRALPNDPRVFELTGYILRRRGQQEEGLRNLPRAVELDPHNFFTLQQIAVSYQFLGLAIQRIFPVFYHGELIGKLIPDLIVRLNR